MINSPFRLLLCASCAFFWPILPSNAETKVLRAGIIGLDTSHVVAFTQALNASKPRAGLEGVRVVAAYPKGSPDIEASVKRVPEYTEKLRSNGVEIVDSIGTLCSKVDVIFLETNDGRPHLEQLRPCLKAKKPVFIDKPVAGSLADAIRIYDEAAAAGVPVFSASSLRYGTNAQAVRGGSIGPVTSASTFSPAHLEPTHPDLFWYGIHGVESLFTVMGPGCVSVARDTTTNGLIRVTGKWSGGRTGVFTEGKGYGGKAVGGKGEAPAGQFDGYEPLLVACVSFFRTGVAPVSAAETLEIYAFMAAADESKRRGGAEVTLAEVMDRARAEIAK